MNTKCVTDDCPRQPVAVLDGRSLCEEHFITFAYRFLDESAVHLRSTAHHGATTAHVARGLDECLRATTRLAMASEQADNLARARLTDILLWAVELLKQVRRGPRSSMSIAVRIAGSDATGTWEEKSKTVTVSRHGASLICSRAVTQGEMVNLTRLDTGEHAAARVVWAARKEDGLLEIGVEFLNDQNLFGIDPRVSDSRRSSISGAQVG